MGYRLTEWGKTRTPLNGVEWGELTDAEFKAANERYEGLLIERGYFEETPDPVVVAEDEDEAPAEPPSGPSPTAPAKSRAKGDGGTPPNVAKKDED